LVTTHRVEEDEMMQLHNYTLNEVANIKVGTLRKEAKEKQLLQQLHTNQRTVLKSERTAITTFLRWVHSLQRSLRTLTTTR
jgi:hypothetical protein